MTFKKVARILKWAGLILFFPLVMLFFFAFFIKTTEEYDCIMRTVVQHPEVVKEIGEPVEPGVLAWSPFFESAGQVRQGYFITRVSGPRGRGRIQAQFYRAPVGATMTIYFESRGEEITLYDGPYVCQE
ncbi:MAG: hypothetical protein ACP5HM_04725 [Anaerolineae bacterium]